MRCILLVSAFCFLICSCGSGESNLGESTGTTVDSKTTQLTTLTTASTSSSTTTKAKVYLGSGGDNFIVSNSGTTVYGNKGTDVVTIGSDVTAVLIDQNVEQINFPGALSIYKFKQTGNLINVYDSTGNTLIARTPVQGDTDGTVLLFSDNVKLSALVTSVEMTLGGKTVNSTTPSSITLSDSSTTSTGSVTVKW